MNKEKKIKDMKEKEKDGGVDFERVIYGLSQKRRLEFSGGLSQDSCH